MAEASTSSVLASESKRKKQKVSKDVNTPAVTLASASAQSSAPPAASSLSFSHLSNSTPTPPANQAVKKPKKKRPAKSLIPSRPPRPKIHKLLPPRPSGVESSNKTGPIGLEKKKSNTAVLVSRKVGLGSYMKRCKALLGDYGNPEITIHALQASIPHAMTLLHSLLSILPFAVTYTLKTTSVKLTDEILPASDDEGDDEDEGDSTGVRKRNASGIEIVLSVVGGANMKKIDEKKMAKKRKLKDAKKGKDAMPQSAKAKIVGGVDKMVADDEDLGVSVGAATTSGPSISYDEDEDLGIALDEEGAMNG